MKRNFFLILFCLSTFFYAQNSGFRFASLTSSEIENINERPEFDFNSKELKNLAVADLLNIYVEEYINIDNVLGKGKMTTLLSLDIDDNGILQNISAIGENSSFNFAAMQVFKKFQGKKMDIKQLKNADLEMLIPITLEL